MPRIASAACPSAVGLLRLAPVFDMSSRRCQPRDGSKLAHQIPVELWAHIEQGLIRSLDRHRSPVGATLNERPENIRDREDANEIGYFTAFEPVGIPRSIEIFVVMNDRVDQFRGKPRHFFKCIESEQRMLI